MRACFGEWSDDGIGESATSACTVLHCSAVTTDCSEQLSASETVVGFTKDRASFVFLDARKLSKDISAEGRWCLIEYALKEEEIVARKIL